MSWPQKLRCPARRFLRAPDSMTDDQCRHLWRAFTAAVDRFEAEWVAMTDEQREAVLRPHQPE